MSEVFCGKEPDYIPQALGTIELVTSEKAPYRDHTVSEIIHFIRLNHTPLHSHPTLHD